MKPVEMYTQPGCPFCAKARTLLAGKGVALVEIDAPYGTPERATSIERAGGRSSVPQIFIGGVHLGGNDDLQRAEREGTLDGLLA